MGLLCELFNQLTFQLGEMQQLAHAAAFLTAVTPPVYLSDIILASDIPSNLWPAAQFLWVLAQQTTFSFLAAMYERRVLDILILMSQSDDKWSAIVQLNMRVMDSYSSRRTGSNFTKWRRDCIKRSTQMQYNYNTTAVQEFFSCIAEVSQDREAWRELVVACVDLQPPD